MTRRGCKEPARNGGKEKGRRKVKVLGNEGRDEDKV